VETRWSDVRALRQKIPCKGGAQVNPSGNGQQDGPRSDETTAWKENRRYNGGGGTYVLDITDM